ncbi:transposase [Mesorhizobium sp. M0152]
MKPYVKSNKTDIIDAEAIAEAATRPTMRFAALKNQEQTDLQALHRVRDQMIGTRTRLINQMRALLPRIRDRAAPRRRYVQSSTCHRFSRTNQTTFRR